MWSLCPGNRSSYEVMHFRGANPSQNSYQAVTCRPRSLLALPRATGESPSLPPPPNPSSSLSPAAAAGVGHRASPAWGWRRRDSLCPLARREAGLHDGGGALRLGGGPGWRREIPRPGGLRGWWRRPLVAGRRVARSRPDPSSPDLSPLGPIWVWAGRSRRGGVSPGGVERRQELGTAAAAHLLQCRCWTSRAHLGSAGPVRAWSVRRLHPVGYRFLASEGQ